MSWQETDGPLKWNNCESLTQVLFITMGAELRTPARGGDIEEFLLSSVLKELREETSPEPREKAREGEGSWYKLRLLVKTLPALDNLARKGPGEEGPSFTTLHPLHLLSVPSIV